MTTPALRGRRRWALAAAALVALIAAVTHCTQVPTNPSSVFSLAVDSAPSPSVVAGDTMRDTLGVVRPFTAHAYNVQDSVLSSVPVKFISLNPAQLRIDAHNRAFGAMGADSIARVVADANGLQSLPFTIPVVLRPDSILYADSDSITTVALSSTSADSNISPGLDIMLRHIPDSAGADSITRTYIVHYQIVYPAKAATGKGLPSDTTLPAYLGDASGNPSRTDTTDVNGMGARQVYFRVFQFAPGRRDSVVVMATAQYRTTPIGRSPLRFVVHYIAPG